MEETTTKKSKRGGARKGAGKKPENGEKKAHITITVDELTLTKLSVLCPGNVSKGVRDAVDVAYDRYSRS